MAKIPEAYGAALSLYDKELSQLSFNIPLVIENTKPKRFDLSDDSTSDTLVPNPNVLWLLEKMLIKVTIDSEDEWFIIDSVEESRDDEDVYSVSCYELPHEMSHVDTGGDLEEETYELKEILTTLLDETRWSLGTIDTSIPELYRSIGFSGKLSIIDAIFQVAETYNVYLDFDSNNRILNIESLENHSIYRGLNIDYGRLLDSYLIKRSSDEIATQLYVYGNDGLGIESVNPTGLPYIEDYSYFMFPFEYDDSAKKVLQSSIYMSDELCIALHKYKQAQDRYELEIVQCNESIVNLTVDLATAESDLTLLNREKDNIHDRLDTAKASEAPKSMINEIQQELDEKIALIAHKMAQVKDINDQLEFKKKRIETIQANIVQESGFTEETSEELQYFKIVRTWENEDYIDEVELFKAGKKQQIKLKMPSAVIDISVANLFNVIEEDFYRDKLKIGDIARVKDKQRNIEYKAPIISIEYEFDENQAQVKIAEDSSLLDENGALMQFVNESKYTNSVVQENGKYWNTIRDLGNEISELINGEWDANKNQISAGVNNETTIGKRGIMVANPDNPDEVIIIQSGIVALSGDKGVTWKTAIRPTGIVAEQLIGRILVGEELVIANENNSFVLDKNGAVFNSQYFKVISSDGDDLVAGWEYAKNLMDSMVQDNMISPYEKKELRTEWAKIFQQFEGYKLKAAVYYPDLTKFEEFNDLEIAYNKLYKYLFETIHGNDTKPILDPTNVTTTSGIDRDEFTLLFSELNKFMILLDNKLASDTRTQLQENQKLLDSILEDIEDLMDDVPYIVRLTSTKGTTFKNNNINTELRAQLLKGNVDLTPNIPTTGFVWKKYDKDGIEDIDWGLAHATSGSSVTITRDDVHEKAIFSVDFYYDNAQVRGERVIM